MSERTPDQKISDANRVESFLQDEVVRNVLIDLEQKYIEEMIAAKASDTRFEAQCKIRAVRGFVGELRAVMSRGEHELIQATLKAKQTEKQPPRSLLQ